MDFNITGDNRFITISSVFRGLVPDKRYLLMRHENQAFKFRLVFKVLEKPGEFNADAIHADIRNVIGNILWLAYNVDSQELPFTFTIFTSSFTSAIKRKKWILHKDVEINFKGFVLKPYPWQFRIEITLKTESVSKGKVKRGIRLRDGCSNVPLEAPFTASTKTKNSTDADITNPENLKSFPSEHASLKNPGFGFNLKPATVQPHVDSEEMKSKRDGTLECSISKSDHLEDGNALFLNSDFMQDFDKNDGDISPAHSECVSSKYISDIILHLEEDFEVSEDDLRQGKELPAGVSCSEEPKSVPNQSIFKRMFSSAANLFK